LFSGYVFRDIASEQIMGKLQSYSVRPDGKITLEKFISMIPSDQKFLLEEELNHLIENGWGELSFKIVNHALSGYRMTLDRNFKNWKNG